MTSKDFLEKFNVPFPNFTNPVEWHDGIGFSVVENDENNHKFASLYKIGLRPDSKEGPVKDLWVSVSYGEKTDGGIILGSTNKSLKKPIDLYFHEEFFYDSESDIFYFQGKEIKPKDILLKIQKVHKSPTFVIKGSVLRFRLLWWRKILPGIVKFLDAILIKILLLVSGERIKHDITSRSLFEKSNEEIQTVEFADSETIDFFGYAAKRWSVVFYCTMHLLGYFFVLKIGIKHGFFTHIFKNNFLALCYVVISFALTEYLLPELLKRVLKKTPSFYGKIIFKRLNVKTP